MQLDQRPGSFPNPPNLVELLRQRARRQAEQRAFTFLLDGEEHEAPIGYGELDHEARAIAARLQRRQMAGERALLAYPAGLEFIAALFGCFYAGAVAVPVPPPRTRSLGRVKAIAADTGAKLILTTPAVHRRLASGPSEPVNLAGAQWMTTGGGELDEPLESAADWQPPAVDPQSLAVLQYTSGSTGAPKGVMLTHANLLHNCALIAHAFEHARGGTGVFWLPCYHDMGLVGGILQPLFVGRPNVLMSPMAFLQRPFRWLQAISRYGGTTSGGPNFAYDLCVRRVSDEQRQQLDLSRWRVAFNGAEPVRAETLEAFAEAFAPCGFRPEAFYPCYGLAEASLLAAGGQVSRPPVIKGRLVGCGGELPDQQIIVVDPDRRTRLADGRVGEIWLRGPSVAQGYWNQPQETRRTFHALVGGTTEGPFLRSGDLGFLEGGELFITGRWKDLIIVHGVNHYAHDIERTAQQSHPALRTGCGAAFQVEGSRPRVIVVQEFPRKRQHDAEAALAAIRRAVWRNHHLRVDEIALVAPGGVSKTSSGKIQRHACRQAFVDGALKTVAHGKREAGTDRPIVRMQSPAGRPSDDVVAAVCDHVRRMAPHFQGPLKLETDLADVGLDSLQRVGLQAALEERFGGRIPDDRAAELHTIGQIAAAVDRHLHGEASPADRSDHRREISPHLYRVELFPEYRRLRARLDALEQTGLHNPFFTVHDGLAGDTTRIGGELLINFAGYNYLGLSGDARVAQAAKDAIDRYGASVSASRLVSGEREVHRQLEQALAEWIGAEAAVVFVGGHATNETTLGHLLGPGDLVLHDALAHNSILQGCRLSGARRVAFPHNDSGALDRLLAQSRGEYRRVLIAVEGVYSMDGDWPDLPRFIEVKRRHGALLMVDEAHSIGVLGRRGRGIGEHFGVDAADVDLWMGTLSKALASCGGYIAGQKALVEYLKYTAPGFVYSVGLSPANAAAALASLNVLAAEPYRVAVLRERAEWFLHAVRSIGLPSGACQGTPIVPVVLGDAEDCLKLSQALFHRGIHVQPIVPPAVPENASRLRFFITAEHTSEQISHTAESLAESVATLGLAKRDAA